MRNRLLCCSDTHGRVPPMINDVGYDAWLHAGDLCVGSEASDLYSEEDPSLDPILSEVANWYRTRHAPVYFVEGNHDVVDLYHAAESAVNLTGKILKIAEGLFVAGIGWHGQRHYELPFEADLQRCCDDVLRSGRRLAAADRIVLLMHYPPRVRGTNQVPSDCDGGGVWFDCVRSVAEELNVVAIVQGHMHKWFGQVHRVKMGAREVLIVNPGPTGCILEIDDKGAATTASL